MLEKDKLFEMTRNARNRLDSEQYPEAYEQLTQVFVSEDSLFIIASNLMECDKPKDFPAFLIEYITALYEVEIDAGNHHAMNNLGAHYYSGRCV